MTNMLTTKMLEEAKKAPVPKRILAYAQTLRIHDFHVYNKPWKDKGWSLEFSTVTVNSTERSFQGWVHGQFTVGNGKLWFYARAGIFMGRETVHDFKFLTDERHWNASPIWNGCMNVLTLIAENISKGILVYPPDGIFVSPQNWNEPLDVTAWARHVLEDDFGGSADMPQSGPRMSSMYV